MRTAKAALDAETMEAFAEPRAGVRAKEGGLRRNRHSPLLPTGQLPIIRTAGCSAGSALLYNAKTDGCTYPASASL